MQLTLWWTKAKRAQSNTDNETWIAGGVVPTLNAMDNNGEAYATALIIEDDRRTGPRINSEVAPTLQSFMGTGGGNVPMVFPIQNTVIGRADENGPEGKGFKEDGEPMFTLDTTSPHAVAYPIDDAREITKHQNGTGIGDDGAPAYTLDQQQAPAVVTIAFDTQFGSNANTFEDVSPTLKASQQPPSFSAEVVYGLDDEQNGREELMGTLKARTTSGGQQMAVSTESVVRRLTPTECERLQGFPDDWTSGQADSNRYKQMGNAVAVPVVQWIVNRMVGDDARG